MRNRDEICEGQRSHLDVNPIKLIKAHPRAPLRQPSEEFPHHLVVDLIRAVEHHAQDADSLSEVEVERSMAGEQYDIDEKAGWRERGHGTGEHEATQNQAEKNECRRRTRVGRALETEREKCHRLDQKTSRQIWHSTHASNKVMDERESCILDSVSSTPAETAQNEQTADTILLRLQRQRCRGFRRGSPKTPDSTRTFARSFEVSVFPVPAGPAGAAPSLSS